LWGPSLESTHYSVESAMTVLGESVIKELVKKYKVIHPAVESAFDGDGYVLTVREDRTLNYLEHRNMISKEIVFTPPDCVAHLTSKSRFGRLGLSFLNSVKVHSGFVGRLALELVNLSNERTPITVREGDPLIHIEFLRREGEPAPYSGRYMFQYMEEAEIDVYVKVLSENFPKVFRKSDLEKVRKSRLVRDSDPKAKG
jgi:dCTP deaminase